MLKDEKNTDTWDTGSHVDFYKYYEQQSRNTETLRRFEANCETLLRVYGPTPGRPLDVLDVGCGAGAQARFWTRPGHRYLGIDINDPLVQLARKRAGEESIDARFEVGTATALPCADVSIDICLLPELLEHVVDWQACLDEAMRVLRPGGLIHISTSSKLCPKQLEFNLPLYSWYPQRLKRYYERRAVTDRPDLANYAKYPAVNWFSFYGLRNYLWPKGFECLDRFDLIDPQGKSAAARLALSLAKGIPPLRFIGHVLTPYTLIVGRKIGKPA
jgi:ubiquinone/menaquinone biosynthesis C-methylase UbiE